MKSELIDLQQKSNECFNNLKYREALEICETICQKVPVDTIEQKRLIYNKAVLYIKLENPDEAKKCLDTIIDEAFIFPILENLAILYETLAILFTVKYNEKAKYKLISECYELSCIYYAKCKKWVEYCINGLENSRILAENGHKKESIIIADKVLSASLYLNFENNLADKSENIRCIKILNNIGIVYSKDNLSKQSSIISAKIFKRITNVYVDMVNENLDLVIYTNSNALRNKLGIKQNSKKKFYPKFDETNEICVYHKFNLAYSYFLSGLYPKSIDNFKEAFNISERIDLKDKEVKSEIKESLGTCYSVIFDYDQAISCFSEALELTHNEESKIRISAKIFKCKIANAEMNARPESTNTTEDTEPLGSEVLELKKFYENAESEHNLTENSEDLFLDKKSNFSVKDMNNFLKTLNQDSLKITAVDLKSKNIVREPTIPKLYSNPNEDNAINHSEEKPIETKRSSLCLIM